jgi:hypothetical protein
MFQTNSRDFPIARVQLVAAKIAAFDSNEMHPNGSVFSSRRDLVQLGINSNTAKVARRHSERSEESRACNGETLRSAQGDVASFALLP